MRILRPQPRLRLGRAAIFAFGGAALSATSGCYEHHLRDVAAEPTRDAGVEASVGLLYGTPPDPVDAGLDTGSVDSLYGGPPTDAGTDAGESVVPAYGTPPPPPEDAGTDEDAGFLTLYGGSPAP